MQLTLFEPEPSLDFTEELFEAYFDCRRNKRNTLNALAFEKYFEHYLFQLKEEILNGSYQPGRSIAFIVNKPVKREIFAADFRDRVVHHWVINKLNPFFEKEFIFDSYACRTAKGTHFGIGRVNDFIRECSKNYTSDCYILKLDIQGFFMHINKELLFGWLKEFIHEKYSAIDKELVLELCCKIIFNDPTKNSVIKGSKQDWQWLPANKSLFQSPSGCGLPIGNLSSQVFANFYLNRFDHFIKNELGIQFYGRYVDDFVIVHPDKEYLKSLIPELAKYLLGSLGLTLHPKKIYLQHYSKGVQFLGTVIKPNRIYIARHTKGNFYAAIQKQNEAVKNAVPGKETKSVFLSSMNCKRFAARLADGITIGCCTTIS
jgi:RNA-directed DNA polymerase